MSHQAIAAVLALKDVSAGERLVAFSLASFANREQQAWPGTSIAAARAGLSRSRYLAARDSLARRGVISIAGTGGGRGNSTLVTLNFAERGPRVEGEINAQLLETVLSRTRTRGSARLLLAGLAALADDTRVVDGVATEALRAAVGLADSTYRRARAELLAAGEVQLREAGGGRGRTNRWEVRDPRSAEQRPLTEPRRQIAPEEPARPLIATARPKRRIDGASGDAPVAEKRAGSSSSCTKNPAQFRTVWGRNPAQFRTVSDGNPAQFRTVSAETRLNPGQVRAETPPQTPPETPPPYVRAGREPQNLGTPPPQPPQGGESRAVVAVEEQYVSDRGRKRRRSVRVDLEEVRRNFCVPVAADHDAWRRIRNLLFDAVGDSVFTIWFEPLVLVATDDAGALVVATDPDACRWLRGRFGDLLAAGAERVGRQLRVADEVEQRALGRAAVPRRGPEFAVEINQQEVL